MSVSPISDMNTNAPINTNSVELNHSIKKDIINVKTDMNREIEPSKSRTVAPELPPSQRLDASDPLIQQHALSYLNNMLSFHGLGLEAKIRDISGQTFVSFSDKNTGSLIRRLKMEDVVNGLYGGNTTSLIDLSV